MQTRKLENYPFCGEKGTNTRIVGTQLSYVVEVVVVAVVVVIVVSVSVSFLSVIKSLNRRNSNQAERVPMALFSQDPFQSERSSQPRVRRHSHLGTAQTNHPHWRRSLLLPRYVRALKRTRLSKESVVVVVVVVVVVLT